MTVPVGRMTETTAIHSRYKGRYAMSGLTRWEPLTRWNPLRELEDMEKRLSTIFGRAPMTASGEKKEAITVTEWSPLVDISEDDKEYVVKAELPEMKKEEIKINVHDDVLSISGERRYEKEEKGKKYHRVERAYGSFMRSFTLPEDADGSKVNAEYKDGLLKVHLPKSEKAKPKAIEVKVT
jgi:HSP20 family protein